MNALIRALTGSGGVAKLLPLRRQFTKIDDIDFVDKTMTRGGTPLLTTHERQIIVPPGSDDIHWIPPELPDGYIQTGVTQLGSMPINYTGRVVGGIPEGKTAMRERLRDLRVPLREHGAAQFGQGWGAPLGLYDPEAKAAMNFAGDIETERHELMHGLASIASRTGELSALPLPMQAAKYMQRAPFGEVRGAGRLLEEAIAHDVGGQMSAMEFLTSGHPDYRRGIQHEAPMVAALFRGAPYAKEYGPAAAIGTGLGAGLGYAYGEV